MSKLIFDLHTHTLHSHGAGSVKDNVEAAISLGLKRIAITDHGPGHVSYGVRDMEKYFDAIDEVKREYGDKIEILSGVELNLSSLDGRCEDISAFEDKLDIRLMGYHRFTAVKGLGSTCYYYLTKRKNIVKNTDAVIEALYKNRLDILTHPGYALPIDIKEVAVACRDNNTLFEINEKHSELTPEDIRIAAEQGARFIISSDAHHPANIGKADKAIGKFLLSGLPLELVENLKE